MPLLLNEAVDRQVLWVCKGDRGMVARYRRSPDAGGLDPQLLDGFFQHSRIALRCGGSALSQGATLAAWLVWRVCPHGLRSTRIKNWWILCGCRWLSNSLAIRQVAPIPPGLQALHVPCCLPVVGGAAPGADGR
jgi:hypothetical protein